MKRSTIPSVLRCTRCNNRQIIHRVADHQRPRGHIKTLWCFRCKARTQHVEGE